MEQNGIRIAVVGMTSLKCRTYPECVNLEFTDPSMELDRVFKELKGKYDIFILASHLGDLVDYALAKLYPQIDMIIEGDFHHFLYKPNYVGEKKTYLKGTPLCQTGELGLYLGKIHFVADDKTKKIKKFNYKLIPITNEYKEDKTVNEILSNYKVKENFKPTIAGMF